MTTQEPLSEFQQLLHNYVLEGHIGTGTTSIVRRAIHKQTQQIVAIKIVLRQYNVNMVRAKNEVQIISRLDHPNVITVYQVYEGMEGICIVMEYMDGGELYDRIAESRGFGEQQVCSIMKKLADAVRYCHSIDIIHRDIKPENLLLSSKGPDAELKLADFGISKILTDEMMITNCGTPVYMAPEIIQGKEYNRSVDIWSIGVTMYYLLSGDYPFKGSNLQQVAEAIKNGKLEFNIDAWLIVSFRGRNDCNSAKNLVRRLLSIDPKNRPTAEQILMDPWFAEMDKELMYCSCFISLDVVVKKIKKHSMKKKVKKAISGVKVMAQVGSMITDSHEPSKQIQTFIRIVK